VAIAFGRSTAGAVGSAAGTSDAHGVAFFVELYPVPRETIANRNGRISVVGHADPRRSVLINRGGRISLTIGTGRTTLVNRNGRTSLAGRRL
jgi:hypothetical protein